MAPLAPRLPNALSSKKILKLKKKSANWAARGKALHAKKFASPKSSHGVAVSLKRRLLRQSMAGVTVFESSSTDVLATPSVMRTPSEVWDRIASLIKSPLDLLNAALTCRFLHAIINPIHLTYHSISASIYCEQLESIARDHRKSTAIRTLTLFGLSGRQRGDENDDPTSCGLDSYPGSEASLLARRRSHWIGNGVDDPLSNILIAGRTPTCGAGGIERVWDLANSMPRLEKLTLRVMVSELRRLSGFFACLPVLDDFEIHTVTCCLCPFGEGPGCMDSNDLDACMAALSFMKCSRRRFSWKSSNFAARGFDIRPFVEHFARITRAASATLRELELMFDDDRVNCAPFWGTYSALRRLSLRGRGEGLTGLANCPIYSGSSRLESIRIIGPGNGELPALQSARLPRLRAVEIADDFKFEQAWDFHRSCLQTVLSGGHRPIRSIGFPVLPYTTRGPREFETFLSRAIHVQELTLIPDISEYHEDSDDCADITDWSSFEPDFRMILAYMRDLRVVKMPELALTSWFKACKSVPPKDLEVIGVFQDTHRCTHPCDLGPKSCWKDRIIDVEPLCPKLRKVGTWVKRGDGYWVACDQICPPWIKTREQYEDRL